MTPSAAIRDAHRVTLARATGALYLAIIVCGLFAEVAVRSRVHVAGDAAATAANLAAAGSLYRLGFAGDVVAFLCDAAVAALLYVLLRPAGRTLALAVAAFRLVGTAIYGANLLNHLAPLLLLDGASGLAAFSPVQLQAMALFFLELHGLGYDLGLVFFGVHCLLTGWAVMRSPEFPRLVGVLLLPAGLVYVVGSATAFLAPAATGAVAPFYALSLLGELTLTVWLLTKGLRPVAAASAE